MAEQRVVVVGGGLAGLAAVSMGALYGMWKTGRGEGLQKAIEVENRMYKSRVETGEIEPDEHKRAVHETAASNNEAQ